MGPTAVGKSEIALELAARLPSEIISVDSGMVYRGMDIGTAKPSQSMRAQVPHWLIDICDPVESYSAAKFRQDATQKVAEILQKGKLPILVGGTMLYFKVLVEGISPLPSANPEVRSELMHDAKLHGWDFLYARLVNIDPNSAARIQPQDHQRIQRALEVFVLTGQSMSSLCAAEPPKPLPYRVINLAIMPSDKTTLQNKIAQRLKIMLQDGFIEEVESLMKRGNLNPDLPAMRAVGYRQVWRYLVAQNTQEKISFDEMQREIYFATCQLAKRQSTWLRSWPNLQICINEGLMNHVVKKLLTYIF